MNMIKLIIWIFPLIAYHVSAAPWKSENQLVSIPIDYQSGIELSKTDKFLYNYRGYRITTQFWLPSTSINSTAPPGSQKLECYLDTGYSYLAIQEMQGCCAANVTSCLPKDPTNYCLAVNSSLLPSTAVSPIDSSAVACTSALGGGSDTCNTRRPLQCEWNAQRARELRVPRVQVLDLFSLNYSAAVFRRPFNWDNHEESPFPIACRLGLFDPAGYEATSLLGEWLSHASSGYRLIMLDLNADPQLNSQKNMVYFRGIPATLPSQMVWGERRLDFWRCLSTPYFSAYGISIGSYRLGASKNDGFDGNYMIALSLTRQYLSLPYELFKEMIQVLPVDCNSRSSSYFCKLNFQSADLPLLQTTYLRFRISSSGRQLGIPLSRLVQTESSNHYLAVSSESEIPENLGPAEGNFAIVFGQQMVESFYLAFDFETKRIGLANKLVADSINLSDVSLSLQMNHTIINHVLTDLERMQSACSSNLYRTFNVATKNCDTVIIFP